MPLLVSVIIIIAAIIYFGLQSGGPGDYDAFATCIKDEGAVFYGAFWCGYCRNQKEMFGNSQKLLPYFECSTPDRKQLQVCEDKNIKGYPTWEFADGSRETGVLSFEKLAEKTGCSIIPQSTSTVQ